MMPIPVKKTRVVLTLYADEKLDQAAIAKAVSTAVCYTPSIDVAFTRARCGKAAWVSTRTLSEESRLLKEE